MLISCVQSELQTMDASIRELELRLSEFGSPTVVDYISTEVHAIREPRHNALRNWSTTREVVTLFK